MTKAKLKKAKSKAGMECEIVYRRYDFEADEYGPSMTAGELAAILLRHPERKVALRGHSGGEVRSLSEIDVDSLHTAKSDASFATRGIYVETLGFSQIEFDDLGPTWFLD